MPDAPPAFRPVCCLAGAAPRRCEERVGARASLRKSVCSVSVGRSDGSAVDARAVRALRAPAVLADRARAGMGLICSFGGMVHQVAPPLWAQSVMGLVVVASAVSWIHITPLYFIAGAEYPEEGGFTGAIDVVTRGGTPDYILSAIPFFLILMATELVLTLVSGLQCVGGKYSIDDAWSSLAAGITQQIVVALVKVPLKINILPYAWIYYNIAVPNGFDKFAPVDKGWVWLATFIVVDLCYYWFHRSAHEIQLLWAGHGIHHQSEYYNLSTALRQSWWASLSGWIFYLPMALMIHPLLYATLDGANVVYQFWVHTCMVRRLPETLEFVLMTPSHHRVHHDRRVHKNFGGFLIIWDRIFGSFQDEYETVRPLKACVCVCVCV